MRCSAAAEHWNSRVRFLKEVVVGWMGWCGLRLSVRGAQQPTDDSSSESVRLVTEGTPYIFFTCEQTEKQWCVVSLVTGPSGVSGN